MREDDAVATYPPGSVPPGYPGVSGAGTGRAYPPGYSSPVVLGQPGLPPPVAMLPVAGTPFGVLVPGVPGTLSGPAVASSVVGSASILVGFVVLLFAATGAQEGWGPTVAGAFAIPAVLASIVAVVLGMIGRRQSKPSVRVTGRGAAIAGVILGLVGFGVTVLSLLFAFALTG